jgi:hypothetical protein
LHPDVTAVAIPLSPWADEQIQKLAALTASPAIGHLLGTALLGERAALNGFRIPGRTSAGGGCRIFETRDGHVALNLSRPDDRASLPALFGDVGANGDDEALAPWFLKGQASALVAQGRTLGLAIASMHELSTNPASLCETKGLPAEPGAQSHRPLVVDLSALWAGPLASRLLQMSGAEVVKVESRNRPDAMRDGDPTFFARLNDGKAMLSLDLRDPDERTTLLALIRRADIVIEAARPRALRQLGIDADSIVQEVPDLVWATITGHGIEGEAANWIGFGDDCGVAGGLSAALRQATGEIGFVGDAIADPLTGIYAARKIAEQRASGRGARLVLSMAGVVAEALAVERTRDEVALSHAFERWTRAEGQAFPPC